MPHKLPSSVAQNSPVALLGVSDNWDIQFANQAALDLGLEQGANMLDILSTAFYSQGNLKELLVNQA